MRAPQRVVVSLAAALFVALSAVASSGPAAAARASAPEDWLGRVNHYRSQAGVAPVAEDPALDVGAVAHARYMVRTQSIGHGEDPASPHYSPEGDASAAVSALFLGGPSSAAQVVDTWITSPFHAVGLLRPWATRAGFGLVTEQAGPTLRSGAALTVLGAKGVPPGGAPPVAAWPGDGAVVDLVRYDGGETPDPLASCPGYQAPSGLPLVVQFDVRVELRASTLTSAGRPVEHCVYDADTYVNPDAAAQGLGRAVLGGVGETVVIVPRHPLAAGASYEVRLDAVERTAAWAFSTARCGQGPVLATFADIAGTVHRGAIECLARWGVTTGTSLGRYQPEADVTREQMASFVARTIERTGGSLPPGPDAFNDDDGSSHEAAINALAAAGIAQGQPDGRFEPSASVTRGQMATFLTRAYGQRTGTMLPEGADAFPDDVGSTHEDSVNRVAAAGLASGFGDGTFGPEQVVTRGQMASFLVRLHEAVAP